MGKLDDQLAIVTGAGRGIGRAMALAKEGAALSLAARTKSEIEAVAAMIKAQGGRAIALPTDVAVEEHVQRLIKNSLDFLGKIDILVNCAGVGAFAPLVETKVADWDAQMDINLKGVFLCCREVLKTMMARHQGQIINISSGAGRTGSPQAAAYCASKFGLMGFTEVLAMEARPFDIKVSAVCPGRTDTTFAGVVRTKEEKERVLKPEDVARVVMDVISASDRAWVPEVHVRAFRWRQS